jgi:cytoskeletal protein RodZ
MFAFNHRIALVVIALSAVACSQTVDGPQPDPSRTGSAQTGQPAQTAEGSQSSKTTTNETTKSTQSQTCPEIDVPACSSSEELVTGVDENGCSFAYCKPNGCPPIDVPQCQPGQNLKYTTDENGCSFADCE